MPSIAPAPPVNGRKRRRDDDGSIEMQLKLSSPHVIRHTELAHPAPKHEQHSERRHILPHPRRYHESKRKRIGKALPPEMGPVSRELPRDTSYQETPNPKKTVDLSPCHICRRKPTVKSELDAFADCEGCGKRTCYICIRECLGSTVALGEDSEMRDALSFSLGRGDEAKEGGEVFLPDQEEKDGTWAEGKAMGHRGMVCSRCCVERGTEGDVWCLGCLRAEGAG